MVLVKTMCESCETDREQIRIDIDKAFNERRDAYIELAKASDELTMQQRVVEKLERKKTQLGKDVDGDFIRAFEAAQIELEKRQLSANVKHRALQIYNWDIDRLKMILDHVW